MNLGAFVGDAPQAVARNVQRLTQALDARPVLLKQVHGTHLLGLDTQSPDYQEADGSYTGQQGLACTVGIADCLPILLCHVADGQATQVADGQATQVADGQATQVGALHAGWRGLAGEQGVGVVEAFFASQAAMGREPVHNSKAVIGSAAKQSISDFESRIDGSPDHCAPRDDGLMDTSRRPPEHWLAWLGPCIGPQAFEVGPEVRAAFIAFSPLAAQAFVPLAGGKFLADLQLLARQRLKASGVSAVFGNDGSRAWCTVANPSRFFSYRRDKVTGRQVASICLR
jgi:copper oxidase (laccase) domain-containing protein